MYMHILAYQNIIRHVIFKIYVNYALNCGKYVNLGLNYTLHTNFRG